MNATCSFEYVDGLMENLQLIIYLPIFVTGLVLNVLALLVFCHFLRNWTESTIYMTNLALMDLVLLFPLPFKMHATRHVWPPHLRLFCSTLESLYFVGMYGSIYTIVCIAVDRWMMIQHPFTARKLRSPKAAVATCFAVWVVVLMGISPIYGFRKAGDGDLKCFHGFSGDGWTPAIIGCLQVFGFLGPALVLMGCSVQSIWALRESEQQSPTDLACVRRIIYSGMFAFLVPFTPSHLAILLQFLVRQGLIEDCKWKTRISLFLQVTMCLANVTCCLDAACYYFITREVRSTRHFRRSSIHRRATTNTSEL
ncbi:G-protein coupled receptor 55 [Aplochiton taeniatus]